MRAITVILLTANLALAAWQFWFVVPPPPPDWTPLPAPPLLLIRELPAGMPPTQAAVPGDDDAPEFERLSAEGTCQALGPFLDREAAGSARDTLAGLGLQPALREAETVHRLGYWVFMPPLEDRDAALAGIERLRAGGIRDFYLVADGEYENAISLGVFSTREAANQHAARLRGLGFGIEVDERRRTVPAWWLDFLAPTPGSDEAGRIGELIAESTEMLGLDTRPCR